MGQLEPLIAMALGRSPYDEEVIMPPAEPGVVQDGQQYDDRGHPINPRTRQWMRDYVRASNEVMQAAGIIEDTSEIRARETKLEARLKRDNDRGLRRLEVGRVVFIAGIWGVCGLRRRVMLYQSYELPLVNMLRQQYVSRTVTSLYCAGLPVLGMYQVVDWLGFVIRAVAFGPYDAAGEARRRKSFLSNALYFGVDAILLQLRMFGTLQQLHLIGASRLLPPLSYFIPFSSQSPIRWPGLIGVKPFMSDLLLTSLLPIALMLSYVKVRNDVTALVYGPVYHFLPRPINAGQPPMLGKSTTDQPDETEAEVRPGTLRRRETMDSIAGNIVREEETEGRIGFEFEETTELIQEDGEEPSASWSAELRSADPPKAVYNITTLTMLPSLLATDTISLAISELIVMPMEAVMVRVLAHMYQRRVGGSTVGMWPPYSFSWRGMGNVLVIHAAEVALLGVIWAGFNAFSDFMGGEEEAEEDKARQTLL